MMKLILAAALAAASTSLVHAEDASFSQAAMKAYADSQAGKGEGGGKAEKALDAAASAKAEKVVVMTTRDGPVTLPGVDMQKTAAIGADSPELVVKHRNGGSEKAVAAKTKSGGSYGTIIARYAAAYGVPVSLAHAVIRVESNYRVNARGSAGEVGLMQIKPSTARGLGYSGSIKALYNPENNIKFGMKYLGMAHKLGGGTTCGTILKYNAGHGAKRMNKISAAYCSKVKRHLGA